MKIVSNWRTILPWNPLEPPSFTGRLKGDGALQMWSAKLFPNGDERWRFAQRRVNSRLLIK
ncbi:MAG TPA: hypothetical protein VF475_07220 [Sphingobium sp.]